MIAEKVAEMPRVARLQFEAVQLGVEHWQVDYELVIPLIETDCRGTWDHKGRKTRPKSHRLVWLDVDNNKRIPLGRTKIQGGRATYPFGPNQRMDIPFRDGAHCGWDNEHLKLPVYYHVNGEYYLLTKEAKTEQA